MNFLFALIPQLTIVVFAWVLYYFLKPKDVGLRKQIGAWLVFVSIGFIIVSSFAAFQKHGPRNKLESVSAPAAETKSVVESQPLIEYDPRVGQFDKRIITEKP